MFNIDPELYYRYTKEQVDAAAAFLSYKAADIKLPKEELEGVPTLYVFRHGQTTDNANFIYSGWRDVGITEEGIKQAEILAEKLKDKKLHMLVASDQIRAIKTMQIAVSKNAAAKNLEIIRDPRIKERKYGDLQGKSKLEAYLENPELSQKLRRSYNESPPHGESIEMVIAQVNLFIAEFVPKMKEFKINVAVSCPGNSIRGFRKHFEHLTEEETAHIETPLAQDYAAYAIK